MNVRLVITFCLFLSIFNAVGQQKELTLKDAVLGQNRIFGPDRMYGFQWVAGTSRYTYYSKNYQTMYSSLVGAKSPIIELLTINDLNKALGSQLSGFFNLEWKIGRAHV